MIIQGAREQLAEKAASILYSTISMLLKKKKIVVIAVPGGGSVIEIYKRFRDCALPWERIHLFLLDERLVPVDHPESNFKLIKEHMGPAVPDGLIHPFEYDADNPTQSVVAYGEELKSCGGRFDIVLASSGEDGHIGSLFPNHHSIEQDRNGFILLNDSPKPPPDRMSAGHNLIRQADTGIVLFLGSGKRDALHNFLNTQLSYTKCPAKIMTKLPHYYLLTDQEVDTA